VLVRVEEERSALVKLEVPVAVRPLVLMVTELRVERLPVLAFVVEALEVEALEVTKLEVLPKRVKMLAERMEARLERKLVAKRLVIVDILKFAESAKMLVKVAEVIVALAIVPSGKVIEAFERSRLPEIVVFPEMFEVLLVVKFEVDRFVVVAFVREALVPNKLVAVAFPTTVVVRVAFPELIEELA
jgi:hypothetical protein